MLFGVSVGRFCIFHPDRLVTLSMHPGLLHKFPDQCYFFKVGNEVQVWVSRLRKLFLTSRGISVAKEQIVNEIYVRVTEKQDFSSLSMR